ncbi:winged helix-turn-helix domain-containing protein [Amycolatopsis sp. CA-230715]|uniref:winged helix-turn-helix domain-containing protein n=1 Tax=Amycolatopsis sp. CA-230715 TaxID=2745196 RepID=UPI001C00A740|nr:transcriptional regulator [Amycolatopsis sp. CA-230715]QWF82487.1 hypothetical protein HUW46_05924 [Amycolatopsis sp. CA-230715]
MTGGHPRRKLDDIIHSPVRLSVMAVLAVTDEVDFRYLKETVEVSDSLLSKHIAVLQNADYVNVTKGVARNRPTTWFSLTETGSAAYREYVSTLNQIIGNGTAEEKSDAS